VVGVSGAGQGCLEVGEEPARLGLVAQDGPEAKAAVAVGAIEDVDVVAAAKEGGPIGARTGHQAPWARIIHVRTYTTPSEPAPVDDCVVAQSNGRVLNPECYNYRTGLPERGGLCAVEVFGAVQWTADDGTGAHRFAFLDDTRAERWGHIALSRPIPHPDDATATLTSIPVMPPFHRRYRMQSPDEAHARSRAFRDRIMRDPDEAYRTMGDPPAVLLGELGLWHVEEDRPLSDEEIEAMSPGAIEPPVSGHYRSVVNRTNRLARLLELDAPALVCDGEHAGVVEAVAALFAHIGTMELTEEVRQRARAVCALATQTSPR
jgi:hypothetical protein